MAGEPQERIGVEIEVIDRGTPVVRRHTEETRKALGEVERASKSSSATVTGGMRTAGVATEGLGKTMQKSQVAAMALAGGLSQAGGRAAQAANAISSLVFTGLNPLGIALAAASFGIAALVSRHSEGAEAAKKHEDAVRGLIASLKDASVGIAGIATGDPAGARRAFLQRQIQEGQAFQDRFADVTAQFGAERARGGATTLSLSEFEKMLALAKTKGDELNEQKRQLAILEGEAAAHAARQLAADVEMLRIAREKMELGTLVIRQRTAEAAALKAIREGNRMAAAEIGAFRPSETPTVGGDRLGGFDETALGGPSVMPFDTDNADMDRLRQKWAAGIKAMEERSPWFQAGTRAGDAMADGISDSLSTAVLTGKFDLADLGKTMGETLVRTFMDALVQAAIGNQMKQALQSLFMSIGGAVGLGGGGETTAGGGPVFAPEMQARGPAVFVAVEPTPIAGERVLASASDEFLRARVSVAYQGQGARGRRA